MYVDGYILLVIYALSVIALGVSIYAVWTLEEVRTSFNERLKKEINKKELPKKVSLIYDPWGQKKGQK